MESIGWEVSKGDILPQSTLSFHSSKDHLKPAVVVSPGLYLNCQMKGASPVTWYISGFLSIFGLVNKTAPKNKNKANVPNKAEEKQGRYVQCKENLNLDFMVNNNIRGKED